MHVNRVTAKLGHRSVNRVTCMLTGLTAKLGHRSVNRVTCMSTGVTQGSQVSKQGRMHVNRVT